MRQLLGGELAPVTSDVGFLEVDAAVAADRFAAWHSSLSPLRLVRYRTRRVEGDFRSLLCTLDPLTSVLRERFLFVPTDSAWTAYFDNGHLGSDVVSAVSVLARDLRCRGIRALATPEANDDSGGAVIFELYGPEEGEFLNYERTLGVAREGGRWEFWESGPRLPFESAERYRAADVRERFTVELLEEYLRELGGIRLHDDDFYAPTRAAFLVERTGLRLRRLEKYPLSSCADEG